MNILHCLLFFAKVDRSLAVDSHLHVNSFHLCLSIYNIETQLNSLFEEMSVSSTVYHSQREAYRHKLMFELMFRDDEQVDLKRYIRAFVR